MDITAGMTDVATGDGILASWSRYSKKKSVKKQVCTSPQTINAITLYQAFLFRNVGNRRIGN